MSEDQYDYGRYGLQRRPGHSKLVWDKGSQTMKTVDPHPPQPGQLLPCPHCGGKADFNKDGERWDQVICGSCGCRGCEYPEDKEKAAAAWNRRSATSNVILKPRE